MNKKIKKILNKKNKSKIVCLTAYSKNIAEILDKYCDLVLVGDSLGSVLYNYKSTKEVTLEICSILSTSPPIAEGRKMDPYAEIKYPMLASICVMFAKGETA